MEFLMAEQKKRSIEVHELDNGKVKSKKRYRIYEDKGAWAF